MMEVHGVCHMRDSSKTAVILFSFVVLLVTMLTSIRVHAQVSGATLTGTVSDSSGAAIPNAEVSIKNVGTGETRALNTDAAGFYTAPNLLPGKYEVTATATGFSTAVRSGIILTVGAQQLLNFPMKVGEVSEKVEVTSEAPDVQLASSAISGVVSQTAVVELPLNGRDWTQLATLQPGVESLGSIQANTGGKDRSRRGYGVQLAISGARPQQNNYRIDGISINDYSNGAPPVVEKSLSGRLKARAFQNAWFAFPSGLLSYTKATVTIREEYWRSSWIVMKFEPPFYKSGNYAHWEFRYNRRKGARKD